MSESDEENTSPVNSYDKILESMRKFRKDSEMKCSSMFIGNKETERPRIYFVTSSYYKGDWDGFGMNGFGKFTFADRKASYSGFFNDGEFDGDGDLTFEDGSFIRTTWKQGQLLNRQLFFADGLEYTEEDWKYLRDEDRRFKIEYDNGMKPAGESYKTANQPTVDIPEGCYDCGDGIYDPVHRTVCKYSCLSNIVRSVSKEEDEWIKRNCRTNPDITTGPCPFLYNKWVEPTLEAEEIQPTPFEEKSLIKPKVEKPRMPRFAPKDRFFNDRRQEHQQDLFKQPSHIIDRYYRKSFSN